jgi:hypothetical protein
MLFCMIDSTFDPSLYSKPPVLTLESGIALCRALATAVPRGMPVLVKRAGEKLTRVADAAQDALARRQREDSGLTKEDQRFTDLDTDQAWRILFARLDAYALLPIAPYPKAARARELHTLLATGLNSHLNLPYPEQLVAMDTVLKRIDDQGLATELSSLCGVEFLEHVRDCQERYRRMVQRRLQDSGPSDNLATHVKAMGRAIVEYAMRVAACIDDDDDGSLPRALVALRPIDNHREATARRASPGGSDPAPADPSPADPTPAANPTPASPQPA